MANVPNWDGSPQQINQYENATIPNPPNGSTVLGWQNNATQNNDGSLLVGSQGPPIRMTPPRSPTPRASCPTIGRPSKLFVPI
jgi:hypothetical protein